MKTYSVARTNLLWLMWVIYHSVECYTNLFTVQYRNNSELCKASAYGYAILTRIQQIILPYMGVSELSNKSNELPLALQNKFLDCTIDLYKANPCEAHARLNASELSLYNQETAFGLKYLGY